MVLISGGNEMSRNRFIKLRMLLIRRRFSREAHVFIHVRLDLTIPFTPEFFFKIRKFRDDSILRQVFFWTLATVLILFETTFRRLVCPHR
jgi:hypothetical protein